MRKLVLVLVLLMSLPVMAGVVSPMPEVKVPIKITGSELPTDSLEFQRVLPQYLTVELIKAEYNGYNTQLHFRLNNHTYDY